MKVWVVEEGAYSSRGVTGVFATAEAAMAANPIPEGYRYSSVPSAANLSRPTGWYQTPDGNWSNGLDWDAACEVTAYEVESSVPAQVAEEMRFLVAEPDTDEDVLALKQSLRRRLLAWAERLSPLGQQ